MKITDEQIKNVKFTIQEKGYSPKEVDDFLDKILEDYESLNNRKVMVSSSFDGNLSLDSVYYDGSISEWESILKKSNKSLSIV